MSFFTDHPKEFGLTYFQHLWWALRSSVRMVLSGLACFVHAFLPFLFKYTASDTICSIYDEMLEREEAVIADLEAQASEQPPSSNRAPWPPRREEA